MINFCLYVFIIYAVASSVKAILFSSKSKPKTYRTVKRTVAKQSAPRKNNIIKLNPTTRRGKAPLRVAFYNFNISQNIALYA